MPTLVHDYLDAGCKYVHPTHLRTRTLALRSLVIGGRYGSDDVGCMAWLTLSNTKVFLTNVGINSWGSRPTVKYLEAHDFRISTQVFGQGYILVWYIQQRALFVCSRIRGQ